MGVFTVRMLKGPTWDPSRAGRDQVGWDPHASFMDARVEVGTVLLGGPVGDGSELLMAITAADAEHVRSALAPDR